MIQVVKVTQNQLQPGTILDHAATRLYVATAVARVRGGIIGAGVSQALDTWKECGDMLQDGSSVASSLVTQMAAVQTQLSAEVSHASTRRKDCITTFTQIELHAFKQWRPCLLSLLPNSTIAYKR